MKRAEAAGAEAIVLTVDAPGLGTRERDTRNRFGLPQGLTVQNLAPLGKGDIPVVQGSGLAAYVREISNQTFRSMISTGSAIRPACRLSSKEWCAAPTLAAPRNTAPRRSSFRTMVDVKSTRRRPLAMSCRTWSMRWENNARYMSMAGFGVAAMWSKRSRSARRAVLVGRPVLWGLAVAGEEGAAQILEILRRELDEAMLLCGSRASAKSAAGSCSRMMSERFNVKLNGFPD